MATFPEAYTLVTGQYTPAERDAFFNQIKNGGGITPLVGKGINLLDNWYFVGGGSQQGGGQFPINQRGQTQYTTNNINIFDRWMLTTQTASGEDAGIKIVSDGVTIGGTNSTHYSELTTVLDPALDNYWNGKELTVSFLVIANNSIKLITATGTGTTTTTDQIITTVDGIQISFGYWSGHGYFCTIRNKSGATIKALAAKLELGSVQTLARNVGTEANPQWVLNDPPPNFQQELAKCQRYLQVYRRTSNAALSKFLHGIPADIRNGTATFSFQIPEMRTNPTITDNNSLQIRPLTMANDSLPGTTTWSFNSISRTLFYATATNENISANAPYLMMGTLHAGGQLIISAEL